MVIVVNRMLEQGRTISVVSLPSDSQTALTLKEHASRRLYRSPPPILMSGWTGNLGPGQSPRTSKDRHAGAEDFSRTPPGKIGARTYLNRWLNIRHWVFTQGHPKVFRSGCASRASIRACGCERPHLSPSGRARFPRGRTGSVRRACFERNAPD